MPGTSPYTGNSAGGSLTSPKPAISTSPSVNIQQDGYTITSLDTFQQSLETCADWIDWLGEFPSGNLSVKSLYIDGVGGQSSSVAAGDGYIIGNFEVGGNTYLESELIVEGTLYADSNVAVDGYITVNNNVGGNSGVFDGGGGLLGVAVSGAVTVATNAGGTSAPTPTFHKGTVYKDTAILAWGAVNNNGTTASLYYGVNVASVTRIGTGSLTVTLSQGVSSINYICPNITCVGENRVGCASQSSTTAFTVLTTNGQTAPSSGRVDCDFFFFVMGA